MPSKTKRQSNFMRMCASAEGRAHATKPCPPKSVAQEYAAADSAKAAAKKRKRGR